MSKPAKKTKRTTKRASTGTPRKQRGEARKPRILVLEGGGTATNAVRRSGAEAIRVNPRDVAAVDEALAAGFDGLLLTGGGDLDPRLYGEKPHKMVYGVSETRDYTEWEALDRAKQLGVPVMGICRGMQLIAVHNGGSLKQHIDGHRGRSHLVFAEKGSRFARAISHPHGMFPSLHHQIVKRHGGNGMKVSGRSKEGYIEVIESPRVLACQFHPEMDYATNEASRLLFDWLAQRAARKAGLDKPTRVALKSRHGLLGGEQLPLPRQRATAIKRRKPQIASVWCCRDCGLRFDERKDRDDHEVWVCGERGTGRRTEPPVGHPDWDDVERIDAELDEILRNGRAELARERKLS